MDKLIGQKLCEQKINLGIEILRMILCFWVLSFHCLDNTKINYFLYYITKRKMYHVPCFCFISFYFSYNVYFSGNNIKFKKRIERLLIPYIFWPFIFFVIDNAFGIRRISLHDLKLQIIYGRQISVSLWYIFTLLFITIIFFIISKLFQHYFLFIIEIISIIIYIMQYSNYYYIFDGYKINAKLTVISTLNLFPLSSIGLIFSTFNLIKYLKTYRKHTLFFSYLILYFLLRYNIFVDLGGFKGILFLFSSSCLFVCFFLLPLDNTNQFYQRIIKRITSYTNGIYCLHMGIHYFLATKFDFSGTFINISIEFYSYKKDKILILIKNIR